MGIKEKIKETGVKEKIGDIDDKIKKIMERYEFVTMIEGNDSRKLIGTYNDINLYYDSQKKFLLEVDGNYFLPEPDQLKEIERKYIILNVKP